MGLYCEGCKGKKVAFSKQPILRSPSPKILSLYLKRFGYDKDTGKADKLFTHVIIPEYLEPLSGDRYRLTGISLHSGTTLESGHYIALVRYGDIWFLCNDSSVTVSNLSIISQGVYKSFDPYAMFYTKL